MRYGGGGYDAEFETILPNLKTPTGLALCVAAARVAARALTRAAGAGAGR